jgi:hypothetical protein
LPERHAFLELKAENVVLTAAKKAEDDDAIIFSLLRVGRKGKRRGVAPRSGWRTPKKRT